MKLTFFGAAKAVTGSCHCVEVRGKKILIDCGLQQGKDERDNTVLDFAPNYIDYVIVTHAHIDHSGRIPLLIKQGFQGQIFATRLTGELMSIMLQDSAHIQEMDAQWKNQKGKRAGRPPVEPLYTVADAAQVPEHLVTVEYGQIIELCEGVKIRFVDAGHLLGSASVEMWLEEDGVEKKIVFSGDIGNHNQPIIRDPSLIDGADYVVMESTYGDRNHDPVVSYTAELAKIIDDTFSKGGNVIIPSFAVGRTQELLYFMREMKKEGLVKSNPDFTVIISASGMCDAGRIRHHLKHNLWREECAIVFVGYQGEGTLGRHLLEGAKQVRLFGEDIAVNASIYNFKGLSSHADRDHLIKWIEHIQEPTPQQIFVVHGDAPVTEIFANTLREKGLPAHAPLYEEVFDLSKNVMLAAGVELLPKKTSYASNGHPASAYHEVELAAMDLFSIIRASKGSSNKDLKKMAAQIRALTERFKA